LVAIRVAVLAHILKAELKLTAMISCNDDLYIDNLSRLIGCLDTAVAFEAIRCAPDKA